MPLGTLDRTPPPFFRQGPSALSKLVFFSALAVFLMVADTRLKLSEPVRQVLAVVLMPLERAVTVPLEVAAGGTDYLVGLSRALDGERRARAQATELAERAARADELARENAALRSLLELRAAVPAKGTPAEVLYEAADPYSRKVFVDRGRTHGVTLGSPVINEAGVIGQVTQVYPISSEVTLLVDKDAAIPVLNARTRQRSAAFGGGRAGGMELRFLSGNADVQPGDRLMTSGLDGVYPPGLPVATVATVDRRAEGGFARIRLEPAAMADGVRHVLVLEPVGLALPPRPEPAQPLLPPKPEKTPRPRPGVASP